MMALRRCWKGATGTGKEQVPGSGREEDQTGQRNGREAVEKRSEPEPRHNERATDNAQDDGGIACRHPSVRKDDGQ